MLLYMFLVGSLSSNHIFNLLYLTWIFGSFILVTLFSNDILSKLINPPLKLIDSIEQLNQFKPPKTSWLYKHSFAYKSNMVN